MNKINGEYMIKKLYFDCETTGLSAIKNGIIQIAGIIEINNEEVRSFNMKIKPFASDIIKQEALDISGITLEDIKEFEDPKTAYNNIVTIFDRYVDKYDRNDKFLVCGYNVRFDIDFLKEFFVKNGNDYLFSYFGQIRDPLPVIQYLSSMGKINTINNKLSTMCEYFGIDIKNAHDAMADIKATKSLIKKIDKTFSGLDIKEKEICK